MIHELNLTARQPQGTTSHHTGNYEWRTCQGPCVAARVGFEPATFGNLPL